jgi:hypothetical protein
VHALVTALVQSPLFLQRTSAAATEDQVAAAASSSAETVTVPAANIQLANEVAASGSVAP